MNKILKRISVIALGLAMAAGVSVTLGSKQISVASATNATYSVNACVRPSGDSSTKTNNAYKGGSSGTPAFNLSVKVGAGTKNIDFYAAAWGGDTKALLSIKNGDTELASFTINTDAGLKSNSPFTLTKSSITDTAYHYTCDVSGITSETTLTFAFTKARAVIWNITYTAVSLTKLATPTGLTHTGGTVSWTAVEHASSYTVVVNGTEHTGINTNSYSIPSYVSGKYTVSVTAIGDATTYSNSDSASLEWDDTVYSDIPTGTYSVNIDYTNVKKNDTVPATVDYSIKADADGKHYKKATVAYTSATASYNSEYTWALDGTMVFTNPSNAKVTSVIINHYDSKRFTVTDDAEQTVPVASASDNLVTYNFSNTKGFVLTASTDKTSAYSIEVVLKVVDDRETLKGIEIEKGTVKTQYKVGQSPSLDGITVIASYYIEEEFSRSEDVTNVATITTNPEVLSESDTSFTVFASYEGKEAESVTITGVSVTGFTGPIANGRYFILDSDDNVLSGGKECTSSPKFATKLESEAFDFRLVDDNLYEISTTVEGTKYYLVCNSTASSGSNASIRVTSSPLSSLKSLYWSMNALSGTDAGLFNLFENTTGTTNRYLSSYTDNSDWRGYINTSNGNPKLHFVEEKEMFASNFVSEFTKGCVATGSYTEANMYWDAAAAQFATLSEENQNVFISFDLETGAAGSIKNAVARYDYIVGKYTSTVFTDFMARSPVSGARAVTIPTANSSNTIWIIVVVSLVSVSALGCLIYIRKSKKALTK